MTDFIVLKNTINNSKLELGYIAQQLNISYKLFLSKMNGDIDFKVSEVRALTNLLKLNALQMKTIFFTPNGDFKADGEM